jgi:hypothetical protein
MKRLAPTQHKVKISKETDQATETIVRIYLEACGSQVGEGAVLVFIY